MRIYGDPLEGITDRDNFAVQVDNPLCTGPALDTDFDVQPGPGSTQRRRDIQNGTLPPHPENFRLRDGVWVTITYEVERTVEGSRIRVRLSDDTETALIIASPANPSKGMPTDVSRVINGLYLEMDTSREVRFDNPVPGRFIGFRNLAAVFGVSGEDLL